MSLPDRSNRNRYSTETLPGIQPTKSQGQYTDQKIDTITTSGTANTETSFTLRAGVGLFEIRTRTKGATLKVAYAVGESATNYVTLNTGAALRREDLCKTEDAITVYVQSSKTDVVVTIESWL